jgi:hypothetical protein
VAHDEIRIKISSLKEKNMTSQKSAACTLIDRFSLKERIVMRSLWTAFTAVGAYGIWIRSPLWAVLYLVFTALGFALVVLPSLCAHCPYPARHDTCLFAPPGVIRRYFPYKGADMSAAEKVGPFAAMAGMVIMPNFWLASSPLLLLLFWIFALPTLAAFPRHFCKRCRHLSCPMNRASFPDAL